MPTYQFKCPNNCGETAVAICSYDTMLERMRDGWYRCENCELPMRRDYASEGVVSTFNYTRDLYGLKKKQDIAKRKRPRYEAGE